MTRFQNDLAATIRDKDETVRKQYDVRR
jgi:hypothetical protein